MKTRKTSTSPAPSLVRHPTARDVAKLAGVSTATVSLVVSQKDPGRVSEKTRAKVLKAVHTLGYRVDANARSLATGISPWISLVVGNLNNPYFSAITMGAYEAFNQDYQLLLTISDPRSVADPLHALRSIPNQIQGFLTEAWALPLVARSGLSSNIVALDWQERTSPDVSTVGFDLEAGITDLATHLLDLGHRKVVYVDADIKDPAFERRRSLLEKSLKSIGGPKVTFRHERSVITLRRSAALLEEKYKEWAKEGNTAIVCATDIQAFGMIGEAPRLGLKIPHDFSIVGFDDLPLSSVISPKLTTVRLSGHDLGFEAASVMKTIINKPSSGHRHVKLPSTLIVRESTGQR